MSKPQRTRLHPNERKQEIITAARKVFESRDYESWTVADVAKEVGVVEGTVLHYFKSKRNLIVKVMEGFYEDITKEMESGIKRVSGTRNKIRFAIYTHTQILINNVDLCAILLKESRDTGFVRSELYELNRRYTSVIGSIIKTGKESGEVKEKVSATLVRNIIFGTIEHYLWDYIHGVRKVNANAVADSLTDLIYSGISNTPENIDSEVSQLIFKLNHLIDK